MRRDFFAFLVHPSVLSYGSFVDEGMERYTGISNTNFSSEIPYA